MVWHSYMLNPRCFLEDCLRFDMMDFWVTGMPWEAVAQSIDSNFNFAVPSEGRRRNFESKTWHMWDNLHDSMDKKISCPKCSTSVDCPWVAISNMKSGWTTDSKRTELELCGSGYGEKGF